MVSGRFLSNYAPRADVHHAPQTPSCAYRVTYVVEDGIIMIERVDLVV
jgi:hypothetical protein